MSDTSRATASAPPLLQRLIEDLPIWVRATDHEAQQLLAWGHAYITNTHPRRADMVTLMLTEEGIERAANQRMFFRDLDDAEKTRDDKAANKAADAVTLIAEGLTEAECRHLSGMSAQEAIAWCERRAQGQEAMRRG